MMHELEKINKATWDDFIVQTADELAKAQLPRLTFDKNQSIVMIEPRNHVHLEYVIRNAVYFCGEGWGLQIFAGKRNFHYLKDLTQDWGEVEIVNTGVQDLTSQDYNLMKKTVDLWSRIRSETVLWIEPDCLLRRSGIDEFLDLDYVGALWGEHQALFPSCRVGNGGLSLRKKSAMLEVGNNANTDAGIFATEDWYFCVNMSAANRQHPGKFKIASPDQAKRFCVETQFYPDPLGLHKTWRYVSPEQLESLLYSISYESPAP